MPQFIKNRLKFKLKCLAILVAKKASQCFAKNTNMPNSSLSLSFFNKLLRKPPNNYQPKANFR